MQKIIILDKPYVSTFLKKTLEVIEVNVLKNESISEFELSDRIPVSEETSLIKKLHEDDNNLIYCNSENSIDWIMENLNFLDLPEKIKIFKDKVRFRELLKEIYPDFFYQEIEFKDLDKFNIAELKKPFILKPSIGFFSMGVYKLNSTDEWNKALEQLKHDVKQFKRGFPIEVVNPDKFIIEEYIEGEALLMENTITQVIKNGLKVK